MLDRYQVQITTGIAYWSENWTTKNGALFLATVRNSLFSPWHRTAVEASRILANGYRSLFSQGKAAGTWRWQLPRRSCRITACISACVLTPAITFPTKTCIVVGMFVNISQRQNPFIRSATVRILGSVKGTYWSPQKGRIRMTAG
jgi:hypothetical protein